MTPGPTTPQHPQGRGDPAAPLGAGEWFAPVDPRSGDPGLRFSCTMCGNCCTGPEGYVLLSDAEASALAQRFQITLDEFFERYTHPTHHGRSLREVATEKTPQPVAASMVWRDCVFLDRDTIPGKAICSVYDARPGQCKSWPFWPSNLKDQASWERTKRTCPGTDTGTLVPVEQIRIQRDAVRI